MVCLDLPEGLDNGTDQTDRHKLRKACGEHLVTLRGADLSLIVSYGPETSNLMPSRDITTLMTLGIGVLYFAIARCLS